MLRQAFALMLMTSVLAACGGGSKSKSEETVAEPATVPETQPAPADSSYSNTITTSKPAPITKGEGSDIPVASTPTAEASSPSLTLFNIGNLKLNWNDIGTAGTVYAVFQRSMTGTFDETQAMQTLNSVDSFSLQELPGSWCYKIRATLPNNQGTIHSNEVCIKGPDPLLFPEISAQNIAATQNLVLNLIATGGGEALHFSCVRDCPNGLTVQESTGVLNWTPAIDQLGAVNPVLLVRSGNQSKERILGITVSESPLVFAVPATQTLVATYPFAFTLAADAHGHPIQYRCLENCPANLTVDAATGAVSWTPAVADHGTHSLLLQAKTAAQTQTQTLILQVAEAPLSFPAIAEKQVTATESLSLQLVANARGANVSYSCTANCPAGLNIQASTGLLTWTPQHNQSGTFNLVVTTQSGSQHLQQNLKITVAEAPLSFPAIADQQVTATENLSLQLVADARGAGVSFSCTANCPPGLSVQASTGLLSWTPLHHQSGIFNLQLTAQSGTQHLQQNLKITVAEPPLSFPALADQQVTATESLSLQLVADARGASVSFSCTANCPPGLNIQASTGLLTWTPQHHQNGIFNLELTAQSGTQDLQQNLKITVAEAPLSFPAIADQQVTATESLSLQLAADARGASVSFSCTANCPPGLSVQASTGLLNWTPSFNQSGLFHVELTAQSGTQLLQQNVKITVGESPLSFSPILAQQVTANQNLSLQLVADARGAPVSYSCTASCPPGLSIQANTGLLSWTPQYNQSGTFQLQLTTQSGSQILHQNLTIAVAEAPLSFATATAPRVVTTENLHIDLQANAGGQSIQFACVSACPAGLVVHASTGALDWTPGVLQFGTFAPVLSAHAGSQTLQQTLSIDVVEAFLNVELSSSGLLKGEQTIGLDAQTHSNLSAAAVLSIQQTAGPVVTLNRSGNSWSFLAPNVRQVTNFAFTVHAAIGSIARDESIAFTVIPNDHAPTLAAFAAQSMVATEAWQVQAVGADEDGDTLEFACILDCPAGLNVDASTGLITWRAALDQIGTFNPSIQMISNGQTLVRSLSLLVHAPDLTLTAAPISGISGQTVSITLSPTTNLHGNLQYSISQETGPVVSLQGSAGHWTFVAPELNFPSNVTFSVIAGNGIYSKQQNFTGRIDPQPIAPTVNVGPDLIKNQSFNVSAVTSPNSQTLAWSKVSGPGTLTFSNAAAASTTISASADGSYVLRLTATNSWGQTGSDDVLLNWDTTAPVVNAGSDVDANASLLRVATATGASTLLWSKTSGPGLVSFSAPSAATTNIDVDHDGDYVLRLTATDLAGNTAYSEFTLSVDKTVPTVDLGPSIVSNLADISLTSTVSNDVTSYTWSKISGPGAVTFATADQEDTAANFSADGVYTVRMLAVDGFGNAGQADLSVTLDRQSPVIQTIALASTVADGYLNVVEHQASHALINTVTATDLNTVTFAYNLALATKTCDASLVYTSVDPKTNDVGFTSSATYKVCVQAKDTFNQTSYATSPNIIYDTGTVSAVLSNLPTAISIAPQLNVTVSGTNVTHYQYKVGSTASILCSDPNGYSVEQDVASPITTDLSIFSDGDLRLCVIGRNISGNWQATTTANQYNWTLDRTGPDLPQNFSATGLTERVKFNWSKNVAVSGYLIVRRADSPVTWQPTAGLSYALGQAIDSDHKVVSLGNQLPAFDNSPLVGTTYFYALYAYDAAMNYSSPVQVSASSTARIAFNIASGFDRNVRVIVPARDGSGKYYIAGDFLVYGNKVASRLARLNADMTLDETFTPPLFNNIIYTLAVAADGKVYVGGAFTTFTGFTHTRLVRLNTDGTVDSTFNVGATGFNNTVQTVALDETLNRLYVGGLYTAYQGVTRAHFAALKTDDGTVDGSFNCGTCLSAPSTGTIYAIHVVPGQSLYIGGTFTTFNSISLNRIARLSAAGAVDTTFTTSTGTIGFDSTVYAIERDSQGMIYVGGGFGKYRGSSNAYRFTRLNPTNGAIDATWPITNKFNGIVYSIKIDSDGSLFMAGDFAAFGTTAAYRLAHVSATGVLDSGFPATGGVMGWAAAAAGYPVLAMHLSASEILIGGAFQKYGTDNVGYFARINRSGSVLAGTPRGTMLNSSSYALMKTSNAGDVVLGGYFTSYKGSMASRLAKVDKYGVQDTSVSNAITTSGSYVYALSKDEVTGKYYAGGTFTAPSGRVARFNANGTADTAFNAAVSTTGFNSDVYALAADPLTGGVYVGGKFTTLKTTSMTAAVPAKYIARLLPSGNLDTNFNVGTSFSAQVNALVVLDDGTLLVGGSFTTYNGVTANRLIRLNADGSPYNGFDIGTGLNGAVQALRYVASEHALYVGGAFTTFRGVSANRLTKIDDAGLLYSGFAISTGLSATVYALDWDTNQEVLWVGGNFSTVRGVSSPRIAGINRDGTLHTAFAPGTISINGDVRGLVATEWGLYFATTGSTYQNQVFDYFGRFLFNGNLQ